MDYITSIRSRVGSIPLLLTAAVVILLNEQNQILLQFRADTHNWGIPGGYMEIGESPKEAGIREVFEETGLQVQELQLVDVFSGPDLYLKYPNGDEVYGINIVYVTKEWSGTLQRDEESLDLRFFPLSALPEELITPHRIILQQVVPQLLHRF